MIAESPRALAGVTGDVAATQPPRRGLWSLALILIGVMFVLRLVYLIWLCPYQLVGDEGYYWEQARHFDLCYDEKGPALAWTILGFCNVFGDTEFAIRFPMLISFIAAAWAVGRLGMACTNGDQRVGLLSVVFFMLMPAFQANSIISTQDGPMILIWVGLTAIGLRLIRRWRETSNTLVEWLLLWGMLGIGVMFKHSVVTFLPGLALIILVERKRLRWNWPALAAQQVAGLVVFLAIVSPMIVWNAQHGWPTILHTAGHLGAGGDQAGQINRGNPLIWVSSTVGGVFGAFGPAAMILMIWASVWAYRVRRSDHDRWTTRFWLMCAAWPSVLFYVALSFKKPVVASWPLPSLVPLMVLLADFVIDRFDRKRTAGAAAPQSGAQRMFDWSLGTLVVYGLGGWLVVSFLPAMSGWPVIGKPISRVVSRAEGHRADAADLQVALANARALGVPDPLIVTRHYMLACLDRFYSPGHPDITTAGKYLAKRSTTFDQWDDTRLDNPKFIGRTLLLCGQGDVPWEKGLIYSRVEPLAGGKFFLAYNYGGPQPNYPRNTSGGD